MRSHRLLVCSLLSLASVAFAALPSARAAAPFTVDPVHSSMLFRVTHLGVGHIYGRFNQFSGTFAFTAPAAALNADSSIFCETESSFASARR